MSEIAFASFFVEAVAGAILQLIARQQYHDNTDVFSLWVFNSSGFTEKGRKIRICLLVCICWAILSLLVYGLTK